MKTIIFFILVAAMGVTMAGRQRSIASQQASSASDVDRQVQQFLDSHRRSWYDMNIPEADGREMNRIILEHGYRNALEIGTSTGHSGIWIAWALSKTGGKLITIDIERNRYETALTNFKAAGVAQYIDARLGDAHEIVPALPGPFDFVFSDADKEWYINYAKAVLPKLQVGACLVTHNISGWRGGQGSEYLQYLRGIPYLETTLFTVGAGMSVSYKKAQ
jgi:caffeoyl-CoA O-methyltransferase